MGITLLIVLQKSMIRYSYHLSDLSFKNDEKIGITRMTCLLVQSYGNEHGIGRSEFLLILDSSSVKYVHLKDYLRV